MRSTNEMKSQRTYRVRRILAKPFDPFTYENDFALIWVDTTESGDPVPLPDDRVVLPEPADVTTSEDTTVDHYQHDRIDDEVDAAMATKLYDHCYLIGYGSTEINGYPTLRLHIGPTERIPNALCAEKLGRYMAPQPGTAMFCADGQNKDGQPVDACQGDSGGPLLCRRRADRRYVAVGVTSYGSGCGAPDTPGVYTTVAGHVTWVNHVVSARPPMPPSKTI